RHAELSVGRPSLEHMTAIAQDSAPMDMAQTGQPLDGAASSPAAPVDDAVDVAAEAPRRPSLSPSRAADFKTCPLLYRFRTIDRIPEPPTTDQARGTLVHAVLERLFALPAAQRTKAEAAALVAPQWERLCDEQPLLAGLFGDGA